MDISARGVMGGVEVTEEQVQERARHPVEQKIIQINPILEAFGPSLSVAVGLVVHDALLDALEPHVAEEGEVGQVGAD